MGAGKGVLSGKVAEFSNRRWVGRFLRTLLSEPFPMEFPQGSLLCHREMLLALVQVKMIV